MNRYIARAHREDSWWVVDVDGVGATQAKRLAQVEHMARDLVAAVNDVEAEAVQIDVSFQLAPDVDLLLSEARSASDSAHAAQQRSAELSRQVVRRLAEEKLPLRDIARLTGVSYQRVHQLLHSAAAASRR